MKYLLALAASIVLSAPVLADIPQPLSEGVECAQVKKLSNGEPDLKAFNAQLKRKSFDKQVELKSVSVSALPNGQFLVCTTGEAKSE